MTSMVARFFADVKGDKAQAVKASLLSNSGLATAVHPLNGQTALQVAVQSAGESVIRALRRHGARWTDVDNTGNNAVHYVSKAGRSDLCKTRKSADWVMALHQPNADGETPLHATLSSPESSATADIIHAFVNVGADINRRNADGKSALDLAEDRLHLVQMMQEAAGAALGNVATASHSVMGAESMMGGNSFIGGSVGGGPLIPVENVMYPGEGRKQQDGQSLRNGSHDRGEPHVSSRQRSSSVAGRTSSSKARSPVRRSPSVFSERAVETVDRSGSGSTQTIANQRNADSLSASGTLQRSSRRSSSRTQHLHRNSANGSRSEQEHKSQGQQQGQALAWMGGGHTWGGISEQDQHLNAQAASPMSSARRRSQNDRSASGGMLRHPAPIRTSVRSTRSLQGTMSEYEGDLPRHSSRDAAVGPGGGYADDVAMPDRTPSKGDMEGTVSMDEAQWHSNAMHAQLDNGSHAAMESESDPSLHRFNSFGTSRLQRNGSVRQIGCNMSGRESIIEDDGGMAGAESPQASVMSARTHRGSHSRREHPRGGNTLAPAGGSFSAMTAMDYEANSARGEPPLAPAMRAQVRSLRSRDQTGEGPRSMRGHSPRRGEPPATPGSVRSVGSNRGVEGRPMQDQVRQMQHALEKAASAMRQLQEDRKADSSELSDFAKCMDAMTERMDIMDHAMQKVVDESADNAHRSGADFEARDDIEKLSDSVGALEAQTDEMKQWLRDNDDKLGDFWGQVEDLSARVGGETREGGIEGLAGVMDALEDTVTKMEKELKSMREQQKRTEEQASKALAEQASRREKSEGDGEAVHATLAELKEEIKVVQEGQQRTEEQAWRALKASESNSGAAVGAVGAAMAAGSGGASSEEVEEVRQKAQATKVELDDVREDVEDVKGAMLQMKEYMDGNKGNWDKLKGRVDKVHGEQKLARGQLSEITSAIERLQAAAPSAQVTRDIAQEASREVATEVAQTAARETAREVAREVAKETATLTAVEAANAAVQESASVRDADIGSLSEPSSPKVSAANLEVLERLQEVVRKVDLLEDRVGDVAAGTKGYGTAPAEVRGAGASSGGSYSPPRTPDAGAEARHTDKQNLDMGSEGGVLPAEVPVTEREVTASKAMLYTNVYNGPSQNLEFSEFSDQITEVKTVAEVATKDIGELRGDIEKIKLKLKDSQRDKNSASAGPRTLGSGFDDDVGNAAQEARLNEIQEVALRADAAREETEESLGIMENRLDHAEHNVKLLQHAVHQHDERIAGFMYSPARNSVSEGSYALKSTVEALESKIMQVEVQYAGRLQAQKAKNDQQASIIQSLLERVSALEHRGRESS